MRALPSTPKQNDTGAGFTVLELLLVLLVISVVLAIASQSYTAYLERTAAQRAAELFALDLQVARTVARRDRIPASVVVLPAEREYLVRKVPETGAGEVVVHRRYGSLSEVPVSELTLVAPADSVAFDGRGIASLGTANGGLGEMRFRAGRTMYGVRFNSMGAAEVARIP